MNIFITGVAGLVGSAFVSDLLRRKDDVTFVAIARSKPARNLTAADYVKEAIEEQHAFDGCPELAAKAMEKITVVEGDITNPESLEKIAEHGPFDSVFHCAADVNLGKDPDKKTFTINYNGTENVLAFAKKHNIPAFHYVSTAYTCGNHVGNTPEDYLVAEGFFNSYEESKFKAETLVRNSGIPFSIYRPSIIVGRTTDGRIRKPLAFYRLLSFFGIMKQRHCRKLGKGIDEWIDFPLRIQAGRSKAIYLVPVDFVQDAITTLFMEPVENKGYHLTGKTAITTKCIEKAIVEIYKIDGFHVTDKIDKFSALEKIFDNSIQDLYPYFASQSIFDQTNISEKYKKIPVMDQEMLDLIVKTYFQEFVVGSS